MSVAEEDEELEDEEDVIPEDAEADLEHEDYFAEEDEEDEEVVGSAAGGAEDALQDSYSAVEDGELMIFFLFFFLLIYALQDSYTVLWRMVRWGYFSYFSSSYLCSARQLYSAVEDGEMVIFFIFFFFLSMLCRTAIQCCGGW